MNSSIIVALLSLLGTALGTLGGIYTSSKLTAYRISELEKKVGEHNAMTEKIPVIEKEIDIMEHKIDDLEGVIYDK